MEDSEILIIIIIILAVYLFYKTMSTSSQDISVPSDYKGAEGLDYIREQYSSQMSQARSLCVGQFKGEWIDTSNKLGCQNMQGFSPSYCSFDIIKNLISLCNSIGGSATCSSNEASCSV